MKQFRVLRPDDIECKVKTINEKGATILLYKTARTDMDILDETVSPENWDCTYSEIKGNLYCTIGIWSEERQRWTYKQDCGIESREDEEGNQKKGEASDAFKRAGFKWGIGRELYTAPFIWIPINKITVKTNQRSGKPSTFDKFAVTKIEYNERKQITTLAIKNVTTGCDVFFWTSDTKLPLEEGQTPKEEPIVCSVCGKPLEGYQGQDGSWVDPSGQKEYTVNNFGKALCMDCLQFEINRQKGLAKIQSANDQAGQR